MTKKVALIILDGWWNGDGSSGDAIALANTPVMDNLFSTYPHTHLHTYGDYVGLPDGQMWNSEVWHLNIWAWRIVYQDFAKINKSILDWDFFQNEILLQALSYAKLYQKRIHILWLLGDWWVHAHQNHIIALCQMAKLQWCEDVFIHGFLDGRDTPPQSALWFVKQLENRLQEEDVVWHIVTLVWRYYAMDRDQRWERIKIAYDLLVHGKWKIVPSLQSWIQSSYEEGITDEFIQPILIDKDSSIKEGDVVIFANFRTDRPRELTVALTQKDFPEHNMKALNLYFCTMSRYDETYKNIHIVFDKDNIILPLGEVISNAWFTQLRIAETEKYPHVTFFFSGWREQEFDWEKRIVVPSPKVDTYDLQPEMSALGVRDAVIQEMKTTKPDFIALNFANPDMVWHTGIISAVIKAVETVDKYLGDIIEVWLQHNYDFVIIADHGNADQMIAEDGTPHTAHTTNLVPCIIISSESFVLQSGKLGDIAPTILDLMWLKKPDVMTGISLIEERN